MFCPVVMEIGRRIADTLDEMLLGDFDLIEDGSGALYADVDYRRLVSERRAVHSLIDRRPCNAPAVPRPGLAGLRSRI